MTDFESSAGTRNRPAYAKRPAPVGHRLLRLADPELARLSGNEPVCPIPPAAGASGSSSSRGVAMASRESGGSLEAMKLAPVLPGRARRRLTVPE